MENDFTPVCRFEVLSVRNGFQVIRHTYMARWTTPSLRESFVFSKKSEMLAWLKRNVSEKGAPDVDR